MQARLPLRARAAITALAMVGACSGEDQTLPHFRDISAAPAALQAPARAVVRIRTARESATGSFISPAGLLLTNNHVLGDTVCPVEGCNVQITFMRQRGAPRQQPQTAFAVPVAVDVGMDVAVAQLYAAPGGQQLDTPDYLSLQPAEPAALIGQHVTVVGHPEGFLKQWSDGVVVDASGQWITTDAYTLPGSSGSPVLNDSGAVVGIIHRGVAGEDIIASHDVNVYSLGTASAPILAAMSAPLPPVVISVVAPATADDVVAHDLVYANARATGVSVNGTPTDVVSLLGDACDAALARDDFTSPDDLSAALVPCDHATTWIDCRIDASPVPYAVVCPPANQISRWYDRFQAMNQKWLAMNGQMDLYPVSFAVAHLQGSMSAGTGAGGQSLQAALNDAQPLLDFALANYLAAYNITSYGGADVARYVVDYRSALHYELQGNSIASAAGWLNSNGVLSGTDLLNLLRRLYGDPRISVGAKLYIEDYLYSADAL